MDEPKYSQTRAFIVLIGLLAALVLCFVDGEEKPKVWSSAISPTVETDEMEDLSRSINIMTSRYAQPSLVLRTIQLSLPKLTAMERTKILYRYHAYLMAERPAYDKKIFYQGNHKMVYKYFYYAYQPGLIPQIEEKPFRDVMIELDASGYYLKRSKNLYHPFIDYDRLIKTFQGSSDEGLRYLEIQKIKDVVQERSDPEKTDYYKNVEKLLLKCDYFINRYPLSEKNHEIQDLFNEELEIYIFGNESFESYDNYTGKVKQSLLNSYLNISRNLSSENLALMLERYTKMVMRNDGVVVNDFLQYIHLGIQKNRSDYFVSKGDHIQMKTALVSLAGSQQYIPKIEGYRYGEEAQKINDAFLENVYKYIYDGWNRGYQTQLWNMETAYEVTFAREDLLSVYQTVNLTYADGQKVKNIECLNYDFRNHRFIQFQDIFVELDLQKRKIMETLNQGITNYDIGTFQTIEPIEFENITNFAITNDGIEVHLRVLDENGIKVGYITVELSYSEFYTIVEPEYRL